MTEGVLFFIHGAAETSEGLAANLSRIEDQVRDRGWDVRVVAPGVASAVRSPARQLEEGALPRAPAGADARSRACAPASGARPSSRS